MALNVFVMIDAFSHQTFSWLYNYICHKCKVLNHIILAKEKHGRENSKSSLFLTVIKCRYLLQKTYLITIRNIMKNRLSYMNSSKFQEIIRHVLPLAKIIRNYWTIEREQGYCTCSQTWGKFNYYG